MMLTYSKKTKNWANLSKKSTQILDSTTIIKGHLELNFTSDNNVTFEPIISPMTFE